MTVTRQDILDMCPTSMPDAVIDDLLCMVYDRIGACITAYAECIQNMIVKYAVCHMLVGMQGGEVTTERAANGASTTYKTDGIGAGEGLRGSSFGRLLLQIDTAGCSSALFPDTVVFEVIGSTDRPCRSW